MDDKSTTNDDQPLLMNSHKHDETLNDNGEEKFERLEADDIAENYTKTMANGNLKRKN